MRSFLVTGCCLLSATGAAALEVASVFGDHMVVQQGMQIPVWGTAPPGQEVSVSLAGRSADAVADEAGRWAVRLGPFEAGGPHELGVAGESSATFRDVLVGEVWVCSGQSNMGWPLSASANAEAEVAAATHPEIRLFQVERRPAEEPLENAQGNWAPCAPETAKGFSAVGYFFGRHLHRELGVPVGLIQSAWGGTAAEWWTSWPAMEADPDLAPILGQWEQLVEDYEEKLRDHQAFMKEWEETSKQTEMQSKPKPPEPPAAHRRPGALYNGMIAPLIPYAIRGAIWYQGESNAGRAYQYRTLFPTMIRDWRANWGQGDLPFLFVQLANFQERKAEPAESAWAELREAQLRTLSVPNTAMAVIIDIGEADDIHPKNKQDVGERLALAGLGTVYGKDVAYSGPIYESMEIEGARIRLHFRHVDGGLVANEGELKGFAVAGADRKFVWAEARIDGDTVLVWNDQVKEPVAARYAWADNPEADLYNAAGLPASPFRTDDWPGLTADSR